jgi:hypothetical protein
VDHPVSVILATQACSVFKSLKLGLTGATFATGVFEGTIASQPLQSALAFDFLHPAQSAARIAPGQWPDVPWETCTAELDAGAVRLQLAHTDSASYFGNEEMQAQVSHDGLEAQLHCLVALSESRVRSWVCGPLLILALARRGVFCLHASAVLNAQGGAVLMLGRSGVGKSTLARASRSPLVDDIAPVAAIDGQLWLLPRFPQLKLAQPFPTLPERVRVTQIWHMQTPDHLDRRALSALELTPIILQHVVASRLFAPQDWHRLWAMLPVASRVEAYSMQAERAKSAEAVQRCAHTLLATYT